MRFTPSSPPFVESHLAQLDPRWKLAGLLPLLLLAAVVRTLPALGAVFCLTLALSLLGKLPWKWAKGQLLSSLVLFALFALPLPFTVREGPGWDLGPVRVSVEGIRLAVLLAGKGLTVVLLGLVLLTSSPVEATLKACAALKVPGLLVQLVLMSYRYLFLLTDELGRLRVALRTRGYRNRADWHSYRTVGNLAGILLVRGHDRAERVAQAMRCRGFDGQFRSLGEFRTTPWDVGFLTLSLGFGLGVLLLDGFPWR